MRHLLSGLAALLFAAVVAVHGAVLNAQECGCGADRATCYKCCPKKHRQCPTQDTRFLPRAYQMAVPPFGPVVESVPVMSSPLLMSQDRYVVSTTRLRAFETEPRLASPRDLSCSAGSRSPEDRLGELERNVEALTAAMNTLKATVDEQNASLDLIKNKLINP